MIQFLNKTTQGITVQLEKINTTLLNKEARHFAKEQQAKKLIQKIEPTIRLLHSESIASKDILLFFKEQKINISLSVIENIIKKIKKDNKKAKEKNIEEVKLNTQDEDNFEHENFNQQQSENNNYNGATFNE